MKPPKEMIYPEVVEPRKAKSNLREPLSLTLRFRR
jgi:hypothetical protein